MKGSGGGEISALTREGLLMMVPVDEGAMCRLILGRVVWQYSEAPEGFVEYKST